MFHTISFALQLITTLGLVALLAIQTDKTEQSGGVMGIGAAGGRSSSGVELAVGKERILKPLTSWIAVGFLFSSLLNAIPRDKANATTFTVVIALYFFVMLVGPKLWKGFTRVFGS